MFDWEHGIALPAMQGNWASSHGEGEVSWFSSSCSGNLGYILELWQGWPFKTCVCSATSGLLSSYEGHLRNLHEAWHGNADASRGEAGDGKSLSNFHSDIGIPINFQQESGIITFEALNSMCLSRCQRDVRPPVQMRRGTRAFSRVSTGHSDTPYSCEMKDESAFKPLHGHSAFFRVRTSRCPFPSRQQKQGPSHIPIAEESLLLRFLWNVGLPLQSKPGNQLSYRDNMGCQSIPRVPVLKFVLF